MDTTEITHISLCSGYGGIDLGLRRCLPLRTVAYAEIEAFAIECLLARMEGGQLDPAPIWTDLRSFSWDRFRDRVHLLSGGYPCQPFSAAGKRLGADDPRHLWPSIAKGIAIMRPRICFFENVEGHISLGLREVIADLERLGYEATWGIFSAAECGAPHQRKRVFILAVAGGFRSAAGLSGSFTRHEGDSGVVDDCGNQMWPARPGQPQHVWEPPRILEPPLGRDSDGASGGLDYAQLCSTYESRESELRLLGNGVVPATAAKAFKTLLTQLC